LGLRTGAIVSLEDIVAYLYKRPVDGTIVLTDDIKKRIDAYRTLYGAVS
jgi:orotate phosphoribosyltransferase